MTSLAAAYLDSSYVRTYVPQRIDGSGLKNGTMDYVNAFSLELSRELIAFTASIYEPLEVSSIRTVTVKLGSRIQIAPLALYLSAVFLYRSVDGLCPPR